MNNPNCPVCPGVGRYLGALGNLAHFRCESCGGTFNEQIEEDPEQDEFVISGEINSAGRYADEMPESDVMYGDSPDY